jgi:6,7-dimethyl-8-ribityllumazine synthase
VSLKKTYILRVFLEAGNCQSAFPGPLLQRRKLIPRLIAGSQIRTIGDLLGSGNTSSSTPQPSSVNLMSPFDAVIAIGVLIKGETMHFEYIADAVSKGLMRIGLDTGVPVIFGLLTVLNEKQAMARAGMIDGEMHNHGDDWGSAAVELGIKDKNWSQGKLS